MIIILGITLRLDFSLFHIEAPLKLTLLLKTLLLVCVFCAYAVEVACNNYTFGCIRLGGAYHVENMGGTGVPQEIPHFSSKMIAIARHLITSQFQ